MFEYIKNNRAVWRDLDGGRPGRIASNEPVGRIVQGGPGGRVPRERWGHRLSHPRLRVCNDCSLDYTISCTSQKYRRAYGQQGEGGIAEYLIAE